MSYWEDDIADYIYADEEPPETVAIEVSVKHESEKAYKFEKADGSFAWVPKSQLASPVLTITPTSITLNARIPVWLAEKLGLTYEVDDEDDEDNYDDDIPF